MYADKNIDLREATFQHVVCYNNITPSRLNLPGVVSLYSSATCAAFCPSYQFYHHQYYAGSPPSNFSSSSRTRHPRHMCKLNTKLSAGEISPGLLILSSEQNVLPALTNMSTSINLLFIIAQWMTFFYGAVDFTKNKFCQQTKNYSMK